MITMTSWTKDERIEKFWTQMFRAPEAAYRSHAKTQLKKKVASLLST